MILSSTRTPPLRAAVAATTAFTDQDNAKIHERGCRTDTSDLYDLALH